MDPRSLAALLPALALVLPLAAQGDARGEAEAPFWWTGRSGALKVATAAPGMALPTPAGAPERGAFRWAQALTLEVVLQGRVEDGLWAPSAPGAFRLEFEREDGWRAEPLTVVTLQAFDGGRTHLNGYHIGRHPGLHRQGSYAAPRQFIEVTAQLADLQVSESFLLGQFLTKDQKQVWPKYLPLDLRLVDKLELIVAELREGGIPAKRVHVMSGYRTPQYNGPGGKGRARFSRHTYGDAADIWVDDDGDGVMDDLNGDGRSDHLDAAFLATVAARVEERFPDLAGGAGIYRARAHRGPFTHIDVRGEPARWSLR